ncbi:MurR/RpiR family transcriptional regulator [Pseudomonas gingeri NCPPB 3146 = LMG 5327]|uniref:MurR/RpiR family transcriptional regulator n=2 Tax=Pseudomonas gingeri TaxID=117681 RepID=A0A7Y7XX40_9PSED|nr:MULTISPECIES: MurR/RpiR family transcriptional regulator [Pseudomonas]NVZ23983.1 MurR/RpiR family transcriptional regulator [Pseudomonas gingeri]NVZ64025.1 MurR/RpiR family transcriptional regulator [Pseudomonas gingeri]NVZ76898.1 MurR/RpiR family transcriptional regulator [Pseudomonas gingeri]NWA10981.1 MurR/RpiR family transcriptional regulator [Pseudomonas gingeri]NWC13935.1 MurR/RpiR family transcriptional regulator [Pseudomonas gingeri]
MTVSLLQRIILESKDMHRAERRVANFVSTSPSKVLQMSMAKLSETCSVSDPTVMRFCRRFGFESYQELKLHLVQSLVPSAPFAYEQIIPDDSIDNIVRKTCRNSLNAIQRLAEDLAPERVGEGARLLQAASWIGIYATGISVVNALDAEHKFQRLGLRCQALLGSKRQEMHAEGAREGEVALIFSQSGHTRQMVDVAVAARKAGARVVSIAADDSPLARVSDVLIAVKPYEHTELMTPLASRLNHHLVTNMLVAAIAVASGSQFPDQLTALDSWRTDKI